YDVTPRWSREVPPDRRDLHFFRSDQDTSGRIARFDMRLARPLGDGMTLEVGGGVAQGRDDIFGVGPINNVVQDFTLSNTAAKLASKHFEARVFWNRYRDVHASN